MYGWNDSVFKTATSWLNLASASSASNPGFLFISLIASDSQRAPCHLNKIIENYIDEK